MCKLKRCPFEEDDEVLCDSCIYDESWDDSYFEDFYDKQKEV